MNALKCEMCNSTDLVKDGDYFVCQNCGTKYTVEAAKKMMVEGTVDVSGSVVEVDASKKIENLYELARRAKKANNSETASKYYNEILLERPNDWEAAFYSAYYDAMNCKIAGIGAAAITFGNSIYGIVDVINKNIENDSDKDNCYYEIINGTSNLFLLYKNNIIKSAYGYSDPQRSLDFMREQGNPVEKMLGMVVAVIPTSLLKRQDVLALYKTMCETCDLLDVKGVIKAKIKEVEPDYVVPVKQASTTTSSSGCYVATCVYGSYDCPEVWTLRRFRDYDLAETWYGRAFVRTYYAISPTIVRWFGDTDWFKNMWRGSLDKMVTKLQNKGYESTPYNDREW